MSDKKKPTKKAAANTAPVAPAPAPEPEAPAPIAPELAPKIASGTALTPPNTGTATGATMAEDVPDSAALLAADEGLSPKMPTQNLAPDVPRAVSGTALTSPNTGTAVGVGLADGFDEVVKLPPVKESIGVTVGNPHGVMRTRFVTDEEAPAAPELPPLRLSDEKLRAMCAKSTVVRLKDGKVRTLDVAWDAGGKSAALSRFGSAIVEFCNERFV